jgi:hypothetical protein
MTVMGLLLLVGLVLTLWWGGTAYRRWQPGIGGGSDRADAATLPPSIRTTVLVYLRGLAIALVGGFWAGALVTGPAVRLIMRLLAVTAGDDAQGRITEADEVVGRIELDGTIGLYIFGGILPGLLSGAIYVLIRRWLPGGRLGGVAFGSLHLVIAATRIDPLRPENPDFDLVGPAGCRSPRSAWPAYSTAWPSPRSPTGTATACLRQRAAEPRGSRSSSRSPSRPCSYSFRLSPRWSSWDSPSPLPSRGSFPPCEPPTVQAPSSADASRCALPLSHSYPARSSTCVTSSFETTPPPTRDTATRRLERDVRVRADWLCAQQATTQVPEVRTARPGRTIRHAVAGVCGT